MQRVIGRIADLPARVVDRHTLGALSTFGGLGIVAAQF